MHIYAGLGSRLWAASFSQCRLDPGRRQRRAQGGGRDRDSDALFKEQFQESNVEKRTVLQKFARMEQENIENIPVLRCGALFAIGKRVKSWMPGLSSSISLSTDELELK
jgi:hypothetical protein